MTKCFKINGVLGGLLLTALVFSTGRVAAQTASPGYFGTLRPADGASAHAPKEMPQATPQPSAAAAATPTPATPEPTPHATTQTLSPVGKWHWHSGGEKVIALNGAVLQDSKVMGQWSWTDRSKGEIQIRFNSLGGRPPMTYSLSPHGNHLSGTDPARKGQTFTEERVE